MQQSPSLAWSRVKQNPWRSRYPVHNVFLPRFTPNPSSPMRYPALALILAATLTAPARADITPAEVLVVYNSQNADSLSVFNHYAAARPGVRGFDLNDPTLAPGNIGYADFEARLRDPLRSYLSANNLSESVVSFVLTKGLPHRIFDTDRSTVGDLPNAAGATAEFIAGDSTYASVDSELTLLWQDLRTRPVAPGGTGEAGGTFDSHADNIVLNPYFGRSAGVDTFDRSDITQPKAFLRVDNADGDQVGWALAEPSPDPDRFSDPGSMYLVTRLDGDTAAQVNASVTRGLNPVYDGRTDRIILDENAVPDDEDLDGTTYQNAADLLAARGYAAVTHETTNTFVIGATGSINDADVTRVTGPVAFLGTYGASEDGASNTKDGYVNTFAGQLTPGAIFNSIESYNGKPLGDFREFQDQASVAEWIANGGSFALGSVWEPFSFSIAQNDLLLQNYFFNGLTWAEAAYASLPVTSWQQVVLGDPLSRATLRFVPEPTSLALLALTLPLLTRRRTSHR